MSMSPNISGGAWIPTTATFAARLALVRHRMGWNLKEAATECGLAMNAWARFEDGIAPRNLIETVDKISARTGVDRFWLTFGEPNPGERSSQDLQPTEYLCVPDAFPVSMAQLCDLAAA